MNRPWSHCGILLPLLFHPYSLYPPFLTSRHYPFRSSFAPLLLLFLSLTVNVERWYAATAVRSDMNTLGYSLSSQVLIQHPLHLSPPTTPPAPHLFLSLTTLEDILTMMKALMLCKWLDDGGARWDTDTDRLKCMSLLSSSLLVLSDLLWISTILFYLSKSHSLLLFCLL